MCNGTVNVLRRSEPASGVNVSIKGTNRSLESSTDTMVKRDKMNNTLRYNWLTSLYFICSYFLTLYLIALPFIKREACSDRTLLDLNGL